MIEVRKIDLEKNSVGVLSPLQSEIIEVLWKDEKQKVRQIHNKLMKSNAALTSVAVDLDRLHKKGIVSRTVEIGRGGPHYIYSAQKTKVEFEKSILDNTVNKLIEKFGPVAVDYFNDRFQAKAGNGRNKK